jgi:hypothetical protein
VQKISLGKFNTKKQQRSSLSEKKAVSLSMSLKINFMFGIQKNTTKKLFNKYKTMKTEQIELKHLPVPLAQQSWLFVKTPKFKKVS